MVKIYVDTNVYLNYLKDRVNKLGKPLGEDAGNVFMRVLSGEFQLIISQFVLEELYLQIEPAEVTLLLEALKNSISLVAYSAEEKARAKTVNANHWQDALHAIIASREKAKYLVTQNYSDFVPYSDLIEPIRPKEL